VPFKRSVTAMDDKQTEKLYNHVLGLAELGSVSTLDEQKAILNQQKSKDVDDYIGQVRVKDFFPHFR
jgi:hypothetical protein